MSLLDKSANKDQLIDILNSMKFPIMCAGGGFAPIGFYGWSADYVTGAPQGWLRCEGGVYEIVDYPELATFYASQHGASNYWGGDGVTTFAVPDLRGEYIRGAGTNSHANQGNGGAVGEHQDATEVSSSFRYENNLIHPIYSMTGNNGVKNQDKINDRAGFINVPGAYAESGGSGSGGMYAVRPTSTSGTFFVKATLSDAEINAFNVYTPREHQVGWWEEEIDGVWKRKPVYQKTISNSYGTISSSITTLDVGQITSDNSIDAVIDMNVTATYGGSTVTLQYFDAGSPLSTFTNYYYYNNHIGSRSNNTGASNALIRATVQYTKTTDEWQTS